ncbi:hypothetical protein AB0J80_03770 [Actinoplanes sp. NPDC049548]|uniref:hypothetical protein n=1 Tax=Actinoplanes sp. NPDC049548 TaxID=3155152 RepID=UPI003414617C
MPGQWIVRWRNARARKALKAAQQHQDREREAALRRLRELAAGTPAWNEDTRVMPTAPLLTPGQRDRSGRRP